MIIDKLLQGIENSLMWKQYRKDFQNNTGKYIVLPIFIQYSRLHKRIEWKKKRLGRQ